MHGCTCEETADSGNDLVKYLQCIKAKPFNDSHHAEGHWSVSAEPWTLGAYQMLCRGTWRLPSSQTLPCWPSASI